MENLIVATYNILHGHDANFDFDVLAESIHAVSPHVVGLQEIDVGTRRSHGLDILEGLKKATGMPYACFAPTMDYDGGQYGIGILSMYPVKDIQMIPLQSGTQEPRCAWRGVISTPWGDVVCINTHLSLGKMENRIPQFQTLVNALPQDTPYYVVMGDFNTHDEREFEPLRSVGAEMVNSGERLCMTFRRPPIAIDHILYPLAHMSLIHSGMVDNPHSDHNLLYAVFQPISSN